MKLNPKEPFGHIYGNHVASYTQHGKFFDGAGVEIDKDGLTVGAAENDESDAVEAAQAFLTELLTGTKVSKAKVVKAAEVEGHSWHNVEEAADLLGVVKFKVGVVQTWKLSEE
jgi:hypothetical protein